MSNDETQSIDLARTSGSSPPEETKANNVLDYFGITSLKALVNGQRVENQFLIDRLLPSIGTSIIAGRPKKGKSTLIRNLALNVANGQHFLNRKTQKGKVLYFALEENKHQLQDTFIGMGATGEENIHLAFCNSKVKNIENLRAVLTEIKPQLVIIDTIARFLKINDINSYSEVSEKLIPFLNLAAEMQTHILFVHHTGKAGEDPTYSGGTSVLGSTAIVSLVDSVMIFKAEGRSRSLMGDIRYGELEPMSLDYDPYTKIYSAGNSVSETDRNEKANLLKNFLKANHGAFSESEIKRNKWLSGKNADLRSVFDILKQDPEIICTGLGKPGDPFKYECAVDSQFDALRARNQESSLVENLVNSSEVSNEET